MPESQPIKAALSHVMHQFAAINAEAVEKAKAQDDFIHKANCGCGRLIHTFHIPGDRLEGRLRPCESWDRADRARTAELWYHNAQGVEQGIAIRLTKWLWSTILKNHLFGCYVRITYQGAIRSRHLRYPEKVFLVEVDKGAITEKFEGVQNYERKSHKPRAGKIRRPEPVTADVGKRANADEA